MNNTRLLLGILMFLSVTECFSQTTDRIKEIRELYEDYNKSYKHMYSTEIKSDDSGGQSTLTIYEDFFKGKMLIKASRSGEWEGSNTEYYYKDGIIQFIFHESITQLNHWSEDVVNFNICQLRFYFDKGQVIKALKKTYNGAGMGDINSQKNIEINYKTDVDANWSEFSDKLKRLKQLTQNLDNILWH